ncbi:MAG: NAD-dependent epimerase/dehydratase family protein [Halodesulfurarchaeum sp.]
MTRALVIGGTRFIGRHTVHELLANGYDVTIFTRGNRDNPFSEEASVSHVTGDRTNDSALEYAAESIDPDVVIDCIAYKPREVEAATTLFEDVDAYVYVSSGDAYGAESIPKREDETPLKSCTQEQAVDDTMETYGNRKAEGDRRVFRAAERGVNAMVVRPPIVYGPHDYTDRVRYWVHRINTHDRILVPGDGTNIWHRAFVEDVARALRIVAESGTAGEAYNVGDRDIPTLDRMVDLIADALDTEVAVVYASERELSLADISPADFPLYRETPHLLSTEKLASLGWTETPLESAMKRTVEAEVDSLDEDLDTGPRRADEERVLEVLDTI